VTIPALLLNQNEQIRTKSERYLYKLFNFHSLGCYSSTFDITAASCEDSFMVMRAAYAWSIILQPLQAYRGNHYRPPRYLVRQRYPMNWRILPLGRLQILNKSDFKTVHLSSYLAAHCHTTNSHRI